VLASENIEISKSVNAGKDKISADEAWELIKTYKTVIVGKGKKFQRFEPMEENREQILKEAIGRSGNLRAPSIRVGDKLIVGFNDDMFEKFIKQ
jgi:arsenate reductase-like glutaredoxin family protein